MVIFKVFSYSFYFYIVWGGVDGFFEFRIFSFFRLV